MLPKSAKIYRKLLNTNPDQNLPKADFSSFQQLSVSTPVTITFGTIMQYSPFSVYHGTQHPSAAIFRRAQSLGRLA